MEYSFFFLKHIQLYFKVCPFFGVSAFRKRYTDDEPGIYGLKPGLSGLAFLPSKLESYDRITILISAINPPSSLSRPGHSVCHLPLLGCYPRTRQEEHRRLPLACLASPLFAISLFWLGWTTDVRIHFIVPMLAGIPFGVGFMLIFMAFLNFLTDAYEIFAASAMAAASTCRSLFGALLPLAARPVYDTLGVAWATSLLGFLSLGIAIIPFAFIKYGERIRANSKFCQFLVEKKRQEAEKHAQSATRVEEEVPPGENV